ncbi:MAG: SulP family inorganic anion transporter [Geminicoccaceae bacterium]
MRTSLPPAAAGSVRLEPGDVVRNIAAGLVCALLTLPIAFSYAALMFGGDRAVALPAGVAMALLTGAVVAIVAALLGSISFGIAGPISESSVPLAAMLVTVTHAVPADLAPEARLATLLFALTAAALLNGVGLFLLGWLRAAVAVRYVPYPVVAGFVAGTGWLLTVAAVRIATDIPPHLADMTRLADGGALLRLLAAAGFAGILTVAVVRTRHFLALPLTLLAGIGVALGWIAWRGIGLEAARSAGWFFPPMPVAGLWVPWTPAVLHAVHWPALAAALPDMLAVLVVTALAVLMSASTLEVVARRDCDMNRQLKVEGVAALSAALLGGFAGGLSASRSMINRMAGATGRLSGVACGLGIAAILAFDGAGLIAYVPKFVLSGLLLYLGGQFLWRWTVAVRRELMLVDWLTVVGIMLVIANVGYVAGVAAGVLAACLTFAFRYSRMPIVKHSLQLAERRSSVDRPPPVSAALLRLGSSVPILQLQGFVFFGSAYRLLEQVRAMLPGARAIVLDFRLVSGLDSSAAVSFHKMAQAAALRRLPLCLAGLNETAETELRRAGLFAAWLTTERFGTLDQALERCEDLLLDGEGLLDHAQGEPFEAWIARELGSGEAAHRLCELTVRTVHAPGDALCLQGEATTTLLFVDSGRVNIVLNHGSPRPLRLRVIEGRTVLGEMAFFTGAARSASMIAETPTVVHSLSRDAYDRLVRAHPEAAQAMTAFAIRLMAERLNVANRLVAAYER